MRYLIAVAIFVLVGLFARPVAGQPFYGKGQAALDCARYPDQADYVEAIQWLLEGYKAHKFWADMPPTLAAQMFNFNGQPYNETTRRWDRMWTQRYRDMIFLVVWLERNNPCKE